MKRWSILLIVITTLASSVTVFAQEKPRPRPTTRPVASTNPAPGLGARPGGGPGMFLQRIKDELQKLDLSDEQKAKVKTIFDETREKLRTAAEEAKGNGEQMREKLREVTESTRSQLREVLTPEQQEKFREAMSNAFPGGGLGGGPGPGAAPRNAPRSPATNQTGDMKMKGEEMGDGMMMDKNADAKSKPKDASPQKSESLDEGLKVGDAAPNLELKRLDGRTVSLSSYKGRVVVLVFGSYSTPTFRQHAAALEQLKKEHELRAEFTVVYTREAHPEGDRQVERNRDEDISVEQGKDEADRKALAKKAKDALRLTIPIAIDPMDDAISKAFGAFPNGAVIIGRDGKIFAKQRWFQPYTLGIAVEQAAQMRVAATQLTR